MATQIWSSNNLMVESENFRLSLNENGNIVLYSLQKKGENENPIWFSDTNSNGIATKLTLSDDGLLVLVDKEQNRTLWT